MNPDVVFLQQYPVPYFGVLSLTARLTHAGFKADVLIEPLEKDLAASLKRLNPKVVGVSVLSTEHQWLIRIVRLVRQALPGVSIVVGGIHAIFYPEQILKETLADFVCQSEGESVLLSLLAEMVKPRPRWDLIPGLSYRDKAGEIQLNERAPLVPFDDRIVEDRAVYYERYPSLAKDAVHRFFSSRGCFYRCSFCYNPNIQDLFAGKGVYFRQKSVDNFIREIQTQCSRYAVKSIFFYDDLFSFEKKWLRKFLAFYKSDIGIPFMCTGRANILDEETIRMLADSGCRTVSFGVETGDERIRKEILNKDVTDEQIVRCGHLLRRYGIKAQTTNMFCLPGETFSDACQTVELNIRARTNYAFSALFMPFPQTALADYCIKKGFLKPDYSLKDMPTSFLTESVLDIADKFAIINLHYLTYFFVCWPWTYKIFRRIVRLLFLTPLFRAVHKVSSLLRHKEERGVGLMAALSYAWRLRKSF